VGDGEGGCEWSVAWVGWRKEEGTRRGRGDEKRICRDEET